MNTKFSRKKLKGFTLIEVLVVVLIVGILATIALPTYHKVILKARAAEAINLLEIVRSKQAVNYSKEKAFFIGFDQIPGGKLTTGEEAWSQTSPNILVIGNGSYEVELSPDTHCAISRYIQNGEEKFSFSISYLKNGLGCTGSICDGFPDVIGLADEVCNNPVLPPPPPPTGCPDPNFNPSSCIYPFTVSSDGCGCQCLDHLSEACNLEEGFVYNPDTCMCDCVQERVTPPSSNAGNYIFDTGICKYVCTLTSETCAEQGKEFDGASCSCTDCYIVNGICSCPAGQVNIEGVCGYCPEQSYYTTPIGNGLMRGHCCQGNTPYFNPATQQCMPCPDYSSWVESSCQCDPGFTPQIIDGVLVCDCGECPTGTSKTYQGRNLFSQNICETFCKCPANTFNTYTGGQVLGGPCHCPEGLSWHEDSSVTDGGYCQCDSGETEWDNKWPNNSGTAYASIPSLGHQVFYTVGIGCCPSGTAGYVFKTNQEVQSSGYGGSQFGSRLCFCPDDQTYNGQQCIGCSQGTSRNYHGDEADVPGCKCPANTKITNTGGAAFGGPCKCPAGLNWVVNSELSDGGYCACANGNSTEFLESWTSAQGFMKSNTPVRYNVGTSCCPPGTMGYQFNTQNGYANSHAQGYNGAETSTTGQKCFCPDNQVWHNGNCYSCPQGTSRTYGGMSSSITGCNCPANTNTSNTGGAAFNGPCRCPAGMNWVENSTLSEGGYCSCANGSTEFVSTWGNNGYNIVSGPHPGTSYNNVGIGCCPPGSHGYRFNYINSYEQGYSGMQVGNQQCFCADNTVWNSATNSCESCPQGTSMAYQGVNSNVPGCKCPANTTMTNTGGAAFGGPCRCPAGMNWVPDSSLREGGYCYCINANTEWTYTWQGASGWGSNSFGNQTTRYNVGISCCPAGTMSFQFNSTVGLASSLTPGYTGDETASTGKKCFCPDSYVWNNDHCELCPAGTSREYTGMYIGIGSCRCPAEYIYIDGQCKPCSQIKPGSVYINGQCICTGETFEYNGQCVTCSQAYGAGATHTPYGTGTLGNNCCPAGYPPESGTPTGCARCSEGYTFSTPCNECIQCTAPASFVSQSFCGCSCDVINATDNLIYDTDLGCCYCAAKDINHGGHADPLFNSNGCYVGSH